MTENTRNFQIGESDDALTAGLCGVLESVTTKQEGIEERLPVALIDVLEKPQIIADVPPVATPEIQKTIVAFVDMLGTSALMENINEENAKTYYGTITGIAELFQQGFETITKDHAGSSMIISDSFVMSVPYESDAFKALVSFLVKFQYTCLASYAEAMRGAISAGDMLVGIGDKIIGPAFIKAYKIEMENAIFPRIVVDRKIIEDKDLCQQSLPFVLDKDGVQYIDFTATSDADMAIVKQQAVKRHSEFESDGKLKILQKWDWVLTFLEQKANGCLDCCKPNSTMTTFNT
jgi:hypothetical protein